MANNLPPPEYFESGELPDVKTALGHYSGMREFQQKLIANHKAQGTQRQELDAALKWLVKSYQSVNSALRKGKRRVQYPGIGVLDKAFAEPARRNPSRMIVYRAITVDLAKALDAILRGDGLFTDQGYANASSLPLGAVYSMEIELPADAPVISLNKYAQGEVLLNRGTVFKILNSVAEPNGRRYLARVELPR